MALRIGIVGFRGIANSHAPTYVDNPLGKLVAICDVVKERADSAAEKYGVKAYYNLKDMLENEDLDIVDVCTGGLENGSWHYEPAMLAMEYGKNVLVEKPLSNDVKKAREMVEMAEKKDVYLGCNLNHYFTPTAEKGKQYIKDGDVGEICYCLSKMGFNGGEWTYSRDMSPKVDGFPYFHMKAFLSHPLSVMRYFCGDVTHIQTFANRAGFRKGAGDVMVSINSIHMKFANGAAGYLLSQRGDAHYGLGGWWSAEVGGTHGTFCIENCIEKITYWPSPKPGEPSGLASNEPVVTNTGIKDFGETFPRRINAFLEDISNKVSKEHLRASGRDALAVLEYTWAIMESYENGGEVVKPNPLPLIKGDPLAY